LSGNVGNSVANLVAHSAVCLIGQGLEKFLAHSAGLIGVQGDEDLDRITFVILAALGGYPAKDDGGEGTQLSYCQSVKAW
jgi:hypothetical protein